MRLQLVIVSMLSLSLTSVACNKPKEDNSESSSNVTCKETCTWQELKNSETPDASKISLELFESNEIEKGLPPGTAANGIPPNLQGLWWMNGNPQADEVVSFANFRIDPKTHRGVMPTWAPETYSYDGNDKGKAHHERALNLNIQYQMEFNDDYTFGRLTPTMKMFGRNVTIPVHIADFTMQLTQDGLWIRESSFFGVHANTYNFRRIMKADGTKEAAYADYVSQVPKMSYVAKPKL